MALHHQAVSAQRDLNVTSDGKIDLIWQMGLTSLAETDNELRLPTTVSERLTRAEIQILECRLSEHLCGAPVVSFKDLNMNVYRVLRMPEMQRTTTNSPSPMSSTISYSSPSSPVTHSKDFEPSTRQYGKKAKIPRPPNAFILYRQKHHPLLKAQNPDLHNNDISVILGRQWKNEDKAMRDKFKALAEELKRQHFIKFPGYQYAPRKSSEKKRRMTARKLAKIQSDDSVHDVSEFPYTAASMTNHNNNQSSPDAHGTILQTRFADIPSLESMIGIDHPPSMTATPFTSTEEVVNELNSIFAPSQSTMPDTSPAAILDPTPAPTTPPNNNDFLNSLIDWDALMDEEFQRIVDSITTEDQQEVSQIQNDHPHFRELTNEELEALETELQRSLPLLE